jgi:DNA-binding MarR family transcriptional regulator
MSETLDPESVARLRAAVLVLSRRLRNRAPDDDLSATELAVLGRVQREGRQTPGGLARAEHVQPPSMTRIVERLEKRGYLRREPDPEDGRQQRISVTDGGLDFIERTREQRNRWLAGQLERLPPTEQLALRTALPALQRLAELP